MADFFNLPPNELTTDAENDDWNVIMVFNDAIEAEIAKGALLAEGIDAITTNQTFSSVLPIGFNSIGGVRLWVSRDDADKALAILRRNND